MPEDTPFPTIHLPLVDPDSIEVRLAGDDTWFIRYVPDNIIIATGFKSRVSATLDVETELLRYLVKVYPLIRQRANNNDETLNQIKIALGQVATYQGIDVSPVAMLVAELVRDHEELEQRIENVLAYADDSIKAEGLRVFDPHRAIALLRGASPIPDTLEGLTS